MFALILPLLFTSTLVGGDWVGNGASLSENRILMAYQDIEKYIAASLLDRTHTLENSQRELLEKMLVSIPKEKEWNPNMIQFEPHSRRFIIDGQTKVAVTDLSLGSPIIFNKDLLNYLEEDGKFLEVSSLQAIALLVHELGHHHNITDHTFLDQVGAFVANQARLEERWFALHPKIKKLGAQLISPQGDLKISSSLHLIDPSKYLDLGANIEKMNLCKAFNRGTEIRALQFWNLHWINPLGEKPQLKGFLAFECQWPNREWKLYVGDQVTVSPELEKLGSEIVFSLRHLKVDLQPCEANSESCLKNQKIFNTKKEQKPKQIYQSRTCRDCKEEL